MRATSVLSEGYLQRPNPCRRSSNPFVRWSHDDECMLPCGCGAATDVTVVDDYNESVEVPVVRRTLPEHRRTRIDFFSEDEARWSSWWEETKKSVAQVFGSSTGFSLMLELTKSDAMSRKGSYVLSFCSVCSVVCVCAIMLTILSSFAVVGLRLAENTYGKIDLEMTPGGVAASAASLNYTRVAQILQTLPPAHHIHSYRIDLSGTARKKSSCTLPDGTVESLWFKPRGFVPDEEDHVVVSNASRVLCQDTCVSDYCTGTTEYVAMVVVDPSRDPVFSGAPSAHIRATLQNLPYGSIVMSTTMAAALHVKAGDDVLISTVIDKDLRYLYMRLITERTENQHILLSLRVGAVIEDAVFPDRVGSQYVLVPPQHFTDMVLDSLSPAVATAARAAARSAKPAEYATRIVFQMPPAEREAAYLQTGFVRIWASVRDWGAPITEKLGANQVTMATHLLGTLSQMQFFSSFVGLIISMIILALSCVSTILIYTLLSIGIETKTYELGIHRMIGFTRSHLVMLVFTNTYFFTVPAWIFGLLMGQLGYWIVRAAMVSYADIPLGLWVSGSAVGWSTLAGLGVPFVAALLPIRKLIMMALPDALNTSRGRGGGVVYRIERGQSRETDLVFFGIGLLGALSGFSLYSFFPTSLLTMNFSLIFYILFIVLMGMLGGLVMLATNFERVMETIMRVVFMCWEAPAVRAMVAKSLAAHRQRNQQTTIMYALSVGFIVFITVEFNIEIASLKASQARFRGADVTVYFNTAQRPEIGVTPDYAQVTTSLEDGTTYAYEQTPLHLENMLGMASRGNGFYFADYIQLERDLIAALGEDVVQGVTYRIRSPENGNLFPVREIRMKTFGQTANFALNVCPVPPNFFDVVWSDFVRVNMYDEDVGRYGLVGGLYTEASTNRAVIATTTNRVFGLRNFSDQFLVETHVSALRRGANNSDAELTAPKAAVLLSAERALAVMDSAPVFLMTKFPNNMGEVLLSLPSAARLTGVPYLSCNVMSLAAMFVRVKSPAHYNEVKEFLRHWLSNHGSNSLVRDIATTVADIETVDTIFTVFFIVTQIVIMLICFFSLMSSMTANVLDSSKEIGVLLCLGMPHMHVYRVYVWEAFILVISSGFLGLLVGMTVAETMLLQSALFTQLFVPFPFPYTQLLIVFVVGLGSAFASSVSPVMYLLRLPSITHILRRVV